MKFSLKALLFTVALFFGVGSAKADIVTIYIDGYIDTTSGAGTFSLFGWTFDPDLNDLITGTITYDTSAPANPGNPYPGATKYYGGSASITVTQHLFPFDSNTITSVFQLEASPAQIVDSTTKQFEFRLNSSFNVESTPSTAGSFRMLFQGSGSEFSDEALPPSGNFPPMGLDPVNGRYEDSGAEFTFVASYAEITGVPEPASLTLMGVVGVGFAARRLLKRRKTSEPAAQLAV